jgi:hypothetical protein
MSVSTDVLNTTQAELIDPDIMAFQQRLPFFAELEKRGQVSTERGTQQEWSVPYGAPGRIIGIFSGDETAPTDRATRINKFALAPHMLGGVIFIPKLETLINEGKRGAYKLYEKYPKATLEMLPIALERYVVGGVSGNTDLVSTADLSGFGCLNGQFSSGAVTGVTNGFLDFTAPASQSDTVLNVAKSLTQYHYNQFQESNNSAELYDKLSLGIREATRYDNKGGGKGPQVLMLDPDSFTKWKSLKRDNVRISIASDSLDKSVFDDVILNTKVVENHFINLADFTGSAAEGVGYGLNYNYIKLEWYAKPSMTKFEEGAIANQFGYVARFESMFRWGPTYLPAHVAFAGTARA